MEIYSTKDNILVREITKKKFFGGTDTTVKQRSFSEIKDISKIVNINGDTIAGVNIYFIDGTEATFSNKEALNNNADYIYDRIIGYLKEHNKNFKEKIGIEDLWSK
jgi:hypothetical protein